MFWLVTTGEPIPVDGDDVRLLRTGIFYETLLSRGESVHWWTSGFDHAGRRHRTRHFETREVGGGRISLVPSPGYGRSISVRRLWDHRVTARRFGRYAMQAELPDIVYCAYPTIAIAQEAVRFGLRTGVPVVVDIRDLWPDVVWDTVMGRKMRFARPAALASVRGAAAWTIRNAKAVIGLTEEYVDWALELANRPRGHLDRAIPVTYRHGPPMSDAQREQAESYWRSRGIDFERHWVVCFLGTIGSQFDFDPVLSAAQTLAGRYTDIRFVFCGQGDGLAAARRRDGTPNVLWPGWVDGPPRRLLLERSRIGLAPYRTSENFLRNLPNKPVEYFANGLPVLHALGGVLDRVCSEAQCGVRYTGSGVETHEAVVSAIEGLITDPMGLEEMSRRAAELFRERFTPEAVTDRLVQHAEEVCAST